MSAKTAEYVSSERRELSRRFDTVMMHVEYAISALALSQTIHCSTLTKFCQQTELLFLPNVNHGVISIPDEYRSTETTPIIVAKRGEKYSLDRTFADHTPSQFRSAVEQYTTVLGRPEIGPYEHAEALRKFRESAKNKPQRTLKLDGGTDAVTEPLMLQRVSLANRGKVTLMGRPFITLNHATDPGVIAPVLTHELEHVRQFCSYPFHDRKSFRDRLIHDELEAYDPDLRISTALMQTGHPMYATGEALNRHKAVEKIVALCDLNPIDDRYAASKAVKRAIKKRDLGHIL